jgi:hypothetical protein
MTSDSNAHNYVGEDDAFWDGVREDDEFWDRRKRNIFERILVKPMKKPLTAPWDLVISDSDMEKLKAGFSPRSFDDKYAFLLEDENGNISIHIIRHFVYEEEYILYITPKLRNDNSTSAKIHSITWEGELVGVKDDVEKAKERIVTLARGIPYCDFENAPAKF